MIRGRTAAPLIAKELRALGPIWLAGCGALAIDIIVPAVPNVVGAFAFALVTLVLGATSIGHEYRHGTLSMLLTQPITRIQILTVKAGVLAVLLLPLVAIAWAGGYLPAAIGPVRVVVLVPACALLLAPWLTMLCRSEFAGTVFAASVPGVLVVVSQLTALVAYGLAPADQAESAALRSAVFLAGMVVACVVGVVATIYCFVKLEAIEGAASGVRLTGWTPAAGEPGGTRFAFRRQSLYWNLAKKEVRLQSLSFAVAGLFVFGWFALEWSEPSIGHGIDFDNLRALLSGVYIGIVTVLVCAIASAEERQLGVLSAQLLMPLASWKQWCVKVGIALGIVAALVVAVPLTVMMIAPGPFQSWRLGPHFWPRVTSGASAVVLIAVVSLYVSSLSKGGLRAFLIAMGVLVAGWQVMAIAWQVAFWTLRAPHSKPLFPAERFASLVGSPRSWLLVHEWVSIAFAAAFVFLFLRLGMLNHRSPSRSPRTVQRQVFWVTGSLVGAAFVLGGTSAFVSDLMERAAERESRAVAPLTRDSVQQPTANPPSAPVRSPP